MGKDIADVKNHVRAEDIVIGVATKTELKVLKSQVAAATQKDRIPSMHAFCDSYLLHNLPLGNELLKALSCLHPDNQRHKLGTKYIEIVAKALPGTGDAELTNVIDEWKIYEEETIPESWFASKGSSPARIDTYRSKVFALKSSNGQEKFFHLSKVVKCALTLAHSNADTDRSLSVNKRMLGDDRSSLSDVTINGLRHVKDAVQANGGDVLQVPVTRKLLSACANTHKLYEEYCLKQQKTKEKTLSAAREEKLVNERAQAQKRKKLEELKVVEKDVDGVDNDVKEELERATLLLNETQQPKICKTCLLLLHFWKFPVRNFRSASAT